MSGSCVRVCILSVATPTLPADRRDILSPFSTTDLNDDGLIMRATSCSSQYVVFEAFDSHIHQLTSAT